MQSLPQKLEASCANLITQAVVTVAIRRQGETENVPLQVFTGLDDSEKALPSATVVALNGQEFPQGSGNFTLNVTVEIRSNADETDLTAHRQLCEDAIGPFMWDETPANLSSQSEELAVLGISNRSSRERIEDRAWLTEFSFDVYCFGQALTG